MQLASKMWTQCGHLEIRHVEVVGEKILWKGFGKKNVARWENKGRLIRKC